MKYRHVLLIIIVLLVIDQWSKIYVKTHFMYNEEVLVMGDWFRLHFLENEGMAFGMKFSESPLGKLILTLFIMVAVTFGFFYLKTMVKKGFSKGALICGALILAGALGNLIDSMFYGLIFTESSFHVAKMVPFGQGYGKFMYGKVVDMFYFPMIDTTWPAWVPMLGGKPFRFFEPVFNIADAAISTGVIVLAVFQQKLIHKHTQKTAKTETQPVTEENHV